MVTHLAWSWGHHRPGKRPTLGSNPALDKGCLVPVLWIPCLCEHAHMKHPTHMEHTNAYTAHAHTGHARTHTAHTRHTGTGTHPCIHSLIYTSYLPAYIFQKLAQGSRRNTPQCFAASGWEHYHLAGPAERLRQTCPLVAAHRAVIVNDAIPALSQAGRRSPQAVPREFTWADVTRDKIFKVK
jgi:hypothetical protein